jgi:hypothetical protein
MLTRAAVLAAFLLVACRDGDPGFEIVKVPMSAYATTDASTKTDGAIADNDARADPMVLCISKETDGKSDDDKGDDGKTDEETNSDNCANTYRGRAYDEKATARHRAKGDDSTVCCYRKGHVPRRTPVEVE